MNLSPISYWHGFLDMTFFFKVVTDTVKVSPSVLPQVFFNRTTRIWNTLANELQLSYNLQISQFKSIMFQYYVDALEHNYDPENPRSWKNVCPSCNVLRDVSSLSLLVVVFNSHMKLHCFYIYIYIFKLWDHCNWLTTVVASLPNKAFIILCFSIYSIYHSF